MNLTEADRARYQAVVDAVAEETRIYELNTEVRESNRRIRESNTAIRRALETETNAAKRRALMAERRDTAPLPYHVSAQAREILLADLVSRRLRNIVGAAEWRRRIDALPDRLRGPVASIVWWDHPTDGLEGLVSRRPVDGISDDTLAAALIACGYSPHQAIKRVSFGDEASMARKERAA
jgi:hypothetical protein